MADMQTYSGGCHCGRVRYEVDDRARAPCLSCNCSICQKRGALLDLRAAGCSSSSSPAKDDLTDYQFNKKVDPPPVLQELRDRLLRHGHGTDGSEDDRASMCAASTTSISTRWQLTPFDGKSL